VFDTGFLKAPVLQGQSLVKHWSDRWRDLSRAVDRLTKVASQDALILLRASFSAPRVQHLLRCSPSADHALLATFNDTLRSAVCTLTNSELTETQWLQATLPITACAVATSCCISDVPSQWEGRKRRKVWYHSPSHHLTVNVLLNNITFLWFLLFSMCHSLHVAVNKCINLRFVHLYSVFYYNNRVFMLMVNYKPAAFHGHEDGIGQTVNR